MARILGGCALLSGCSPAAAGQSSSSIGGTWETEPSVTPQADLGPWEHWGELSTLPVLAVDAPSQHFGGGYSSRVRGNALASGYGARGRAPFDAGALIVAEIVAPGDDRALAVLVMERMPDGFYPGGGNWKYLAVNEEGTIEASGRVELCARCHAEAPREHVFEDVFRPTPPD